jgi:hypothetical protein
MDVNDYYDKNTHTLNLPNCWNSPLINLPSGIKTLITGNKFNHPIDDNLPDNITSITFGICFNHPVDNLPTNLISLSFDSTGAFNQPIGRGTLPNTLMYLYLSHEFNQPISQGTLPKSLTTIKFGHYFNKPIDNLPENLTHLELGYNFNQPISQSTLPKKLSYLTFGQKFNQSIDDLPNELVELRLGYMFNQPINNLPFSLQCLSLCKKVNIKEIKIPFGCVVNYLT